MHEPRKFIGTKPGVTAWIVLTWLICIGAAGIILIVDHFH